jgi:replicative DNA helicase
MKLARPSVELAVLRGACHKDKRIAGTVLGQIDDSYFHFPESVELYQSIRKHMKETGESPTYRLLIDDPGLSDAARQHMRDSQVVVTSIPEAHRAVAVLDKYRKARAMYNMAASINDAMQGSKVDVDQLLEATALQLNIARSKKSNEQSFVHFGVNNNSRSRIKSILYEDRSENIIPSTIEAFDEVARGFTRGSLVTIGANSGGGKSLMANAMALGMAMLGYRVLVVPLEMSEDEMTCRAMANISGYDLTSILTQQLAMGEREAVEQKMERWLRKVRKVGGRYTIFKPKEDMTLEEVYASTAAFEYDVTILDYVSLLAGTDGEDMWRALGSTARYGKINAEVENRLNILLCQVDDTGKIRYSRAMSEHSNNSWIWVATEEDKESGIMTIDQPKSRNSRRFKFRVKMDYAHMRVESAPNDDALGSIPDEKTKDGKPGKDGSTIKPKRKNLPNLAADI